MAGIAIAALNFGAMRVIDPATPQSSVLGFGVLPMANILVVGLLVGYASRRRPFMIGFEIFGAIILVAYIALAVMHPYDLIKYVHLGTRPYDKAFARSPLKTFHLVVAYAIGTLMLLLPQLAFAMVGGIVSLKLRGAERLDRIHRR
jgi:hypothetical protein